MSIKKAAPHTRTTPPTQAETIQQRMDTHGSFPETARVAQNLKLMMEDSTNWDYLPHAMKESLEMIQTKVGRILTGDPTHRDSWHDIAGYAVLIEQLLE